MEMKMREMLAATCEPRKMSPIEEEFSRLDKAVQSCAEIANDLGESISPILRDATPEPAVQAGIPYPPSPLGGRLREISSSVEQIRDRLQDLRNRNALR